MFHRKKFNKKQLPETELESKPNESDRMLRWQKLSPRRKITLLVVSTAAIILIGVCVLLAALRHSQPEVNISASLCQYKKASPIYDQSVKAIKTNNQKDLKKVVEEIKRQDNYKQDPNCLYPIIYNNFQYADIKSAESNYKLLKKSYDTNKKMAQVYLPLGVSELDSIGQWVKAQKSFYSSGNNTSIIGITEVKNNEN